MENNFFHKFPDTAHNFFNSDQINQKEKEI